ncbi:carbonic anhydrase [Chromohalobacter sp. 11-W]|uniref:carbonic anhydrase n=1 Tax=Chromohalobacter sp. 11-W TaxID=2994061 RepID=UPI002468D79F|nr:carbonic anhydrase [Chromohalobacter sp. 11-W]
MQFHERVLLENQAWVESMLSRDPDHFERLQSGQSPEAFWIGCSDSRVPAEQLCNASPGDLFVHRNVANLVATEDPTFLSALEYAISVLGVRYIIVCGHEGCGGVGAACSGESTGLAYVDAHLKPVVAHYERVKNELSKAPDEANRVNDMVRRHVAAQADHLADLDLVRNAEQPPLVVGLVYSLDRGALEPICERTQAAVA